MLLTILTPPAANTLTKYKGIKPKDGNSTKKSFLISPNLNKNVFHTKINTQNQSMNWQNTPIPMQANVNISSKSY